MHNTATVNLTELARATVARQRRAQGLPDTIRDPAVLNRTARLLHPTAESPTTNKQEASALARRGLLATQKG